MQKKPFCYALMRRGKGHQDLLFKRLYSNRTGRCASNLWSMHLDIDDSAPASVLIFVRGNVPKDKVMSEINKAQTYFREQTEEVFQEQDATH